MATKRDGSNPLMAAAAKKAKKDVASTSKRKYTEETPGGLLIVRAPRNDTQIPPRQPTAGPSEPPPAAKKFKADGTSRGLSVPATGTRTASVDPVVEKDVREMEDEADRLRRASRAHTTIDPTLASTSISFRPPSPEKPPPKPKPKAAKGKKDKARAITVVDTQVPILDGTPQAERNKLLRGDAMAAIARDREREAGEQQPKSHSRRSSLGGRGKRISSSFQAGAFTLPHPKVNDDSFYKHIDRDLPDAEQLRQLFTWTASRASTSSAEEAPPEDAAGLESIKDDMVRMLAERRIDLSLFGPEDDEDMAAATGTNAQNEKNRQWEVVYTKQLQDAQDEDEDWKKAKYFYEAHAEKERKRLAGRRSVRSSSSSPSSHSHPSLQLPDPTLLSDRLRHGLQLAQAPSPSPASTQIRARLPALQFKFDLLHANLNSARTCARVAGRALDARFGMLGEGLAGRAGDPTQMHATAVAGPSGVGGGGEETHTHNLLRALTRVDMARPPGMVGDAARRAAREVERATKAGEGERRLTLTAPPGGAGAGGTGSGGAGTPRRPGTPRRERERTPGGRERERTPGK
ncbi:Mis12-Mtw1 protein family-domain-containing protein [Mycena alexandri]|uniref:Mis12-Mtw1 protein family-domain-containing protein n=1 Tax=Mycena alexandri TaxID=1745969 RepID=A0AAD6X5H6_9AGAR|nr:Mis12-Mtw1 protein family-domain-containing protein [Mycena alexandri]